MKISVHVVPKAKHQKIIKDPEIDYHYKIYLNAPPQKNKANKELIYLLSKYFKIPKTKIIIQNGPKSRLKIIELKNI